MKRSYHAVILFYRDSDISMEKYFLTLFEAFCGNRNEAKN